LIGKDNSGVGASGDGGVTGDFQGAHDLAEGLFAASAPSQTFEGGDSNGGEEAHDANDGQELDEGEGRPASLHVGKPCWASQGFNFRRF
jgi:hypothetical protein